MSDGKHTAGHTPGPWIAYHGHNPQRWFVGGHHYGTDIDLSDICELRNENREANARLIAAAPDMFDALEAFVRGCDHLHTPELIKARSAILRATGEGA